MSGNHPGPSNAPIVQVPAIVFCLVAPMVVGTRFWSRIRVSNNLGIDDWTILGSLVFSLAVSILMLESCHFGFGQHIANLTPHNKKITLQLFVIAQAFYKININLTKCSILLLYLRIFVQKVFRILCWAMLAIVLSYGIASTTAAIFQCIPVARAWDKSIPGTCINITMNWYANAGFSIATDVVILLLPMPIIHSLRLQRTQKIGLMFIFGLGAFVVVTSSLRMTTINFSSTSADTTYDIASSMWTIIESNIGIICACLPCCRPILTLLLPSVFPATESNSNYEYQGSSSNIISGSNGKKKFPKAISTTTGGGGGKNTWIPPSRTYDVQLSSIHASRHNSEEYILQQGIDDANEKIKALGIHKVTQFTVDYHDSKV